MRAFHHPATGFKTGFLLQRLGLFPPRTDMGREAKLRQQFPHFVIVIPFVQTHPLRGLGRWVGPLYGDAFNGLPSQLEIIPIRAIHGQTDGHAMAVGEDAAFGADFAAIRGVLAHLFPPPRGALVIAPSMANHSQSIPWMASYSTRPCSHKATKTSASTHSWKRRWAELLEQIFVSFSAFHWQPVRSTKKMASMALRSSTRGRWHPNGCGLRGGSKGTMRSHNSSGIRQSRRAFSWSSGISEAPRGEYGFP